MGILWLGVVDEDTLPWKTEYVLYFFFLTFLSYRKLRKTPLPSLFFFFSSIIQMQLTACRLEFVNLFF